MKLYITSFFLGLYSFATANTIIVNTASNQLDTPSGAEISLREAIRDAGQNQATISFAPNLSGAVLNGAFYRIESPDGSPGGVITIDASDLKEPIILSNGNGSASLPNITVIRRTVRLYGLEIQRENANAVAVSGFESNIRMEDCVLRSERGFALSMNRGSLVADDCEVPVGKGLSLLNVESVTMNDSSIYHSKEAALRISPVSSGAGAVLLRNCTFAENLQRSGAPGAVVVEGEAFSSVTIDHCSIVDNATAGLSVPVGAIISNTLFARNAYVDGVLTSLVEGPGRGGISGGYNLADDAPAALSQTTDTINTDTKVSRIGYFGGDRLTCFPLAGSPAIDGGNPKRPVLVPGADGRGFFRNGSSSVLATGNTVDIGAVETNPNGAIMVTSAANSGAGSLRAAIEIALTEVDAATHHIIIDSSMSGQVLTLASVLFAEENHNLNIDGSALAVPLEITGDLNVARIVFSSAPGDFFLTGSLTSVALRNIDNGTGTTSSRSPLEISGGCRFGLQRLIVEDNRPLVLGAVDVFDGSEVYFDECLFRGNRQPFLGIAPPGGAALSVRDAEVTVWNSTFIGNLADISQTADGGAVLLDATSKGTFRHCTFARNKASRYGGAIHFTDGGANAATASLERCTFFENSATEGGAISAPGFTGLSFRSCLFAGNTITATGVPETTDLYPGAVAGPSVSTGAVNWSDATATSRSLATQGLEIRLAAPGFYGGLVPTAPFLIGGVPTTSALPPFDEFSPRDAIREPGFSLTPASFLVERGRVGAVQRAVGAAEVLQITDVDASGTNLQFTVSGAEGIRWQLETSTDLGNDWDPRGLYFEGGISYLSTFIPTPRPEKFFIRFREVE